MFCKKKIVVSIASSGFVGSDAMFKTKPKWHEAEVLCLDGDEDPCCAVKTSRGENKLGRVFLIFEGVPQGWEKNVEVSETFCFDKRAWKKTLKSLKAEKQKYLEHLSKTKPEVFLWGGRPFNSQNACCRGSYWTSPGRSRSA